jgi:hypothetical protein
MALCDASKSDANSNQGIGETENAKFVNWAQSSEQLGTKLRTLLKEEKLSCFGYGYRALYASTYMKVWHR